MGAEDRDWELLREVRESLARIDRAFAGSEERRKLLDATVGELRDGTSALGAHLSAQDSALGDLKAEIAQLDGKLGSHLGDHRALLRARVAFLGGAGLLASAALTLFLTLLSVRAQARDLERSAASRDTTIARVALMSLACTRELTPGLGRRPQLLTETCADAVAAVRDRLDGLLLGR